MYLRVNATADKVPLRSCSIMTLFKDIIFRSWAKSCCQTSQETRSTRFIIQLNLTHIYTAEP